MGEASIARGAPGASAEEARLRALRTLRVLDTPPDEGYDRIARTARTALEAPVAFVSFIDRGRQWFKAIQGLHLREIPRRESICTHTIAEHGPLVIPDTTLDPRSAHLPTVQEEGLRFYAGYPVCDRSGHRVGTVAVLDHHPRQLDHRQLAVLESLAGWAEAELARSAEAYERLFDDAPIPLWEEDLTGVMARLDGLRDEGVRDLDGYLDAHPEELDRLLRSIRLVAANPEAMALVDADGLEDTRTMFDQPGLITPDARRFMRRRAVALWEGASTLDDRVEWRTLTGRPFTCYVRWSLPRVAGRLELSRSLVALVDLTPIEEAEAARRRTERLHRTLVEQLPVGVAITRAEDGALVEANPALVRMLGYPDRETLLASTAEERYADISARGELLQLLDREGEVSDLEVQARRYDGTSTWVRASLTALRGDDGSLEAIYGVFVDDTERRRAAEETARLLYVLEHTSDLVTITRFDDARMVYANAACRRLLGLGPDDDPERLDLEQVYRPEHWHRFRAEILPALLDRDRWEGEVEVEGRDGRRIPTSQVMVAHRDRDGRITHVSTIARDLSEYKRSEEELRQSRDALAEMIRSKDQFLASISHELRTPLTVVVGLAHELATSLDTLDTEEAAELASHVHGQATELAHLVEDLLVAARADSGAISLHPVPVEVSGLVHRIVSDLEPVLASRSLQVDAERAEAWADPLRVRQVMRNLLTNAVRYGGEHLRVEVTEEDGRVRVAVCDDGPGIPDQLAEQVFEPYGRAHGGSPGSVGLGLSISRTLAQLMEGDLIYRRDGSWSVFELTLPRRG